MNYRRFGYLFSCLTALFVLTILVTGYKSARVYNDVASVRDQVKYLLESGETIETVPAETALSASYLEIIFGDNPDLLAKLKEVIDRASKEKPYVLSSDISAVIVTYTKNESGEIDNVALQIMGEFPLGKRPVGLQEGGYFDTYLNDELWTMGQTAIRFLGRSMSVLTSGEETDLRQQKLVEAVFAGDVYTIAEAIIQTPIYYTALIPMPRQILPPRFAAHVKTLLLKGYMSATKASAEMIMLSPNQRSAERVEKLSKEMSYATMLALRTQFGGAPIETEWSENFIPTWWAYEMANTLEAVKVSRADQTVSFVSEYDRVMVNATLKALERFGQDYSARRLVRQEKITPEDVRAARSKDPNYYNIRYDAGHAWGPDWPFGASGDITVQTPEQLSQTIENQQSEQLIEQQSPADSTAPAQ